MIELLPWDSQFFGKRIGRLTSAPHAEPEWQAILEEAHSLRLDCVYLLLKADDASAIRMAQYAGFQMVDIRLTYELNLSGRVSVWPALPPRANLRLAQLSDLPIFQELARQTHRDTRFFTDEHFDPARSAEMYAEWISKSLHGAAQAVWTLTLDNAPAGYLTCHLESDSGQLGLAALQERTRGRGLGLALFQAGVAWLQSQGAKRVEVVTQGRNLIAQRLYQGMGFRTSQVQLWFHKWFSDEAH